MVGIMGVAVTLFGVALMAFGFMRPIYTTVKSAPWPWGTSILVIDGDNATALSVPGGREGQILTFDPERHAYKWVEPK